MKTCSCAGAGQHYDSVSRTQPSNSADQRILHRSTGSGISEYVYNAVYIS